SIARYKKLCSIGNSEAQHFKELIDRALGGEEHARTAIVETALCLGVGISNLIVGFSPEAVVVGGEIARAWCLIESALRETIEHSVGRGLPSALILPSPMVH